MPRQTHTAAERLARSALEDARFRNRSLAPEEMLEEAGDDLSACLDPNKVTCNMCHRGQNQGSDFLSFFAGLDEEDPEVTILH